MAVRRVQEADESMGRMLDWQGGLVGWESDQARSYGVWARLRMFRFLSYI